METIVTAEQAKKLKRAGYPQPETVEVGQYWYVVRYWYGCNDELFKIETGMKTGISPGEFFHYTPYYAPTIQDLSELAKEVVALIGEMLAKSEDTKIKT